MSRGDRITQAPNPRRTEQPDRAVGGIPGPLGPGLARCRFADASGHVVPARRVGIQPDTAARGGRDVRLSHEGVQVWPCHRVARLAAAAVNRLRAGCGYRCRYNDHRSGLAAAVNRLRARCGVRPVSDSVCHAAVLRGDRCRTSAAHCRHDAARHCLTTAAAAPTDGLRVRDGLPAWDGSPVPAG